MAFRYLLFLVASIAVTGGSIFSWPFEQRLQRRDTPHCYDPDCFMPFFNRLHPHLGIDLTSLDSYEAMEEFCRDLYSMQSCLDQRADICDPADAIIPIVIRTVQSATTYVCNSEVQDVIISENACWRNTELYGRIDDCKEQLGRKFRMCFTGCTHLQMYKNCIESALLDNCDEAAAQFSNGLFNATSLLSNFVAGCIPGIN